MVGSTSRVTATRVVAGRISPNTSLCARPTACQCAISVTYLRVRTPSPKAAPACSGARPMLRSAWTAWAYGSPAPTILPLASVAVVPDTWTTRPTRTARAYPTTGSHGVPLAMFCRSSPFNTGYRRRRGVPGDVGRRARGPRFGDAFVGHPHDLFHRLWRVEERHAPNRRRGVAAAASAEGDAHAHTRKPASRPLSSPPQHTPTRTSTNSSDIRPTRPRHTTPPSPSAATAAR